MPFKDGAPLKALLWRRGSTFCNRVQVAKKPFSGRWMTDGKRDERQESEDGKKERMSFQENYGKIVRWSAVPVSPKLFTCKEKLVVLVV